MTDPQEIDAFVNAIDPNGLRRVADALNIPSDKRDHADLRFRQAVCECLKLDYRNKAFKRTTKKDREELESIIAAARKLSGKLLNRSDAVEGVLARTWLHQSVAPNDFLDALDCLKGIEIPHEKDGRKMKNEPLFNLVNWLEGIAAEFGGTASIKGETGRLVNALNILRDLLPPGMVPEKLPYSSIVRWKNEHSRIRQAI
jgi:hypothetical protein